jgi:hypothetical protein
LEWRPIIVLAAAVTLAASPLAREPVSADADALPWHYVSASNGSDAGNDCTDREAPCATIQHAIDESGPNPFGATPSIVVAPGIYEEELTIDKPISLEGPNSRIDRRGPEAVIEGENGTAITPEASNITIKGFTVSTDKAGTPIHTRGAGVDRLWITDNIIEGGTSGVWLGAGGARTEIGFNVIESDEYGIRLGAASYSELTIRYDSLKGPEASYGVFAGTDTEINGFSLEGDEFARASLDASISNAFVEANEISPPIGGVGLRIDLTDANVNRNSFEGGGAASCLQLLGAQGGRGASSYVYVSENEFAGCNPYALQLGPETKDITVTVDTFPNDYDGITTDDSSPWDVTDSGISVFGNSFFGLAHFGVDNSAGGELDARDNWWGCNGGPGTAGCNGVSSGVKTSPNVVLTAEARETGPPSTSKPIDTLDPGGKAWILAYLKNGDGSEAENVRADAPISFSSPKGTFAGGIFTAGEQPGPAEVVVTLDNQQVVVPLTINGSLPASPSASLPSLAKGLPRRPAEPKILIPGKILSLSGRRAVVGTLSCARSACRVDRRSAEARVGRMRFDVKLETPTDIAAEDIGQIRAILSEGALRQLSSHGAGTLTIRIKMTDANGGSAAVTRHVKIEGVTGS